MYVTYGVVDGQLAAEPGLWCASQYNHHGRVDPVDVLVNIGATMAECCTEGSLESKNWYNFQLLVCETMKIEYENFFLEYKLEVI